MIGANKAQYRFGKRRIPIGKRLRIPNSLAALSEEQNRCVLNEGDIAARGKRIITRSL
jgi:hypothetical protein